MEKAETVFSFPKNKREEVRASFTEFNGHELVELRVYVADENGVGRPTKKGLTLKVSYLPELKEAVDKLFEAATARGKLETGDQS